ncbi:sialidase family protein [Flavihumibacter sp. UBA7668]|uniref:sialidase family protein n=1 Tax=Flavihumibacter sp. UBA7668 TaxID=1946542 RepID=UPI0025BCCBC1|nr:sialidase family protein [Flavihumibacter sp. UBA7668]
MVKSNSRIKTVNFAWIAVLIFSFQTGLAQKIELSAKSFQVPILKELEATTLLRLELHVPEAATTAWLQEISLQFKGTTRLNDIKGVRVFSSNADSVYAAAEKKNTTALFALHTSPLQKEQLMLSGNLRLNTGRNYIWVAVSIAPDIPLQNKIGLQAGSMRVNKQVLTIPKSESAVFRVGSAVRQLLQDNVHTSRIPGMATAKNGDLLVIYDARYESARDLQGDIDIGLNRSTDKGATWQPFQVIMDKGSWGNLPEKFNGISDPCILVDPKTGTIFVAGLWMYGVLDADGKWTEGLTDTSKNWNHQWKAKGSQPGFSPKETAQFLLTKSTDHGKTWSEPINLTAQCKRPDWWLWAPAPGSGIVLKDGTLVFPTQGRDATGKAFSNITYSRDGGKSWITSNPALEESTTECMAVELSDGSIMLNMRTNSNKGLIGAGNGRSVAITKDLGKSWKEHETSRKALIEPVCMASLYKHRYMVAGKEKSVLLFLNPHSYTKRDHITLQVSYDDGKTWPVSKHILLDELSGRGYSSISSVDTNTIGLLYESSQAQLVFQQIPITEIIE